MKYEADRYIVHQGDSFICGARSFEDAQRIAEALNLAEHIKETGAEVVQGDTAKRLLWAKEAERVLGEMFAFYAIRRGCNCKPESGCGEARLMQACDKLLNTGAAIAPARVEGDSSEHPGTSAEMHAAPAVQPRYQHDCYRCEFLGQHNEYDLYYCAHELFRTVIARTGDDGSEYISGWTLQHPALVEARRLYEAKVAREPF